MRPWRKRVLVSSDSRAPAIARHQGGHSIRRAPKGRRSRGGRPVGLNAADYKNRNGIERGYARLKQWRGLATRFDTHAVVYRSAVVLNAVIAWTTTFRHAPSRRHGCSHLRAIRVSGRRPDQGVSKDESPAICQTDKLLAVLCVVWDHPRGAGISRPRLHKEPSEEDSLMTRTDEASEATPRRPRKKAVHFAKRCTLRFSDDEERAVDDVRRALAKSSGRDLEEVSFSEALRLLITDREAAAEVEARALVIERTAPDTTAWSLAEISDRLGYELGPIRNHIAHIGGNLNQIAKRLNSGDHVTRSELVRALQTVAELRDIPDDIEKRIAYLVDRGLPARGAL